MPEVPLCIHCRKPIDENADQYVVTTKIRPRAAMTGFMRMHGARTLLGMKTSKS